MRLAGTRPRPSEALHSGEEISWSLPPAPGTELQPEEGELRILHEDDWVVALDKPPGIAVHPGAGRPRGTLVHRLLRRFPELAGVGGPGRPGIVHRLDLGTSGLLLVARTPASYQALVRLFSGRNLEKRYLAVVWGEPAPSRDRIEAAIGRHPSRRKEMAVLPRGRPAVSTYRTLGSGGGLGLLEVRIETGRTHQIRVHLRHRGCPLVGDPVYGEGRWRNVTDAARRATLRGFPRPALHAWRLALPHPKGEGRLELEAPVPDDLRSLWTAATGTDWPALPTRD